MWQFIGIPYSIPVVSYNDLDVVVIVVLRTNIVGVYMPIDAAMMIKESLLLLFYSFSSIC